MPVFARVSTNIANRDVAPRILSPAHLRGGVIHTAVATFELSSGDSIGSTYRICEVPSNAIIDRITYWSDAITSAAMDVGLFQTTENGGALVDIDAYASAVTIATAIVLGTEAMFEARNIDTIEQRVFQDAGLTADPGRGYDIVARLTAASTAAGTLSMRVQYRLP